MKSPLHDIPLFPPFLIPAARRALLAIALAGCTTYDYVPPASEAGRQCLATCEVARQTCRAGVSQTGAQQAATTELARSNQLATCLAGATSADDRKACQRGANNGVLLNTQQHSQPSASCNAARPMTSASPTAADRSSSAGVTRAQARTRPVSQARAGAGSFTLCT